MTSRYWWLGLVAVVAAITLHALVPRYEWQHVSGYMFVRVDRWTGRALIGSFGGDGRWKSVGDRP